MVEEKDLALLPGSHLGVRAWKMGVLGFGFRV